MTVRSADRATPGSATLDRAALDLRLLGPALCAWAVVAILLWLAASPWLILGVASGGVGLAAVGLAMAGPGQAPRRRRAAAWQVAGLCGAAVATVSVSLWGNGAIRSAGALDALVATQAVVHVEGVLDSDPRPVLPRPGRRVDGQQVVVTLRVERVVGRGAASEVGAPVLVVAGSDWLGLAWQQHVVATGRLSPADPGEDVVGVLHVTGSPRGVEPAPLIVRGAAYLRARFRAATAGLPSDAAGLVPGLVIGDTSATPQSLTDAMKTAGLTHLSAVSGSNVSIVLALALGVCRAVGVRRRWRPIVAGVALAGFVVLARPEPSVIRAAVMGAVGLVGLGFGRRRIGVPALSTAVLVLLCWDPWLARSFGFALSVLATLGLLVLAPSWGRWVGRRLPTRLRGWGPTLVAPVAAQAMCAPVVVLLQGSVSLVAIPANLAAEPLVAPATIAGVATAAVAAVWLPAADVLSWAPGIPALGISWVARTAASLPGGTLPWPGGAPGALLLAGLTLLALVSGPWAWYAVWRRPLAMLLGLVVVLGAAAPIRDVAWPMPGWGLVACSVGQGDALVLSSGPGRAVLVDVGPDPVAVDGCLRRLGVTALDAVILTHFHADHVEGLAGALHGRAAAEILTSPIGEPSEELDRVLGWAGAAGVPVTALREGDRLAWGSVQARVWWPARLISDGSIPNNASVVLTVSDGTLDAVLLGDIEREAARAVLGELRRDPEFAGWRVDVVKVAHHGSANSDVRLLDSIAAPLALICVGLDNDYGHPAPSTLKALRDRGFEVRRTDLDGDIAVGRPADGPILVATRGP